MQGYIVRRFVALIPTLIFASFIVFITVRLIPGNIIDLMLSQNDVSASKQTREQLEAVLGLDTTIYIQYFKWMGALLFKGSLGNSLWTNTPVMEEILFRLPVTFELGVMALLVSLVVGVPIGVYAALKQDTIGDYVLRTLSILALAIPGFWVGTLVMVFPSIWWGWSPSVRYVSFSQDPWAHVLQLLIPALILGKAFSAVIMRLTRTLMLEVLRQDYIRTARAKGLSTQGSAHGHDRDAPCAAQCADPGGDAGRPAGAVAVRRRGDPGADLRHSGNGAAAARGCRQP